MSFQGKLQPIRYGLGMTLQNMADLLGVSKTSIFRWEQGEQYMNRKRSEECLRRILEVRNPLWPDEVQRKLDACIEEYFGNERE